MGPSLVLPWGAQWAPSLGRRAGEHPPSPASRARGLSLGGGPLVQLGGVRTAPPRESPQARGGGRWQSAVRGIDAAGAVGSGPVGLAQWVCHWLCGFGQVTIPL